MLSLNGGTDFHLRPAMQKFLIAAASSERIGRAVDHSLDGIEKLGHITFQSIARHQNHAYDNGKHEKIFHSVLTFFAVQRVT